MTSVLSRRRSLVGLLVLAGLVLGGAPLGSTTLLAQDQVLFLSVTDAAGTPVTDMSAEEIVVQWDGEDSDIREMARIEWPVRVTVMVDNSAGGSEAIGDIRAGLKDFLGALPVEVEVGLITLGGRPQWIARHTTDRQEIENGVDLVVPDSGAATYLDGLVEEAERLSEDDERMYFPVIVMVASDGPSGSGSQQQKFETAIDQLMMSSATVHTRMLSHGNQGALQSQVAEAVSQATRGSFETIGTGSAFRTLLPELAAEIARKHELVSSQYRVVYRPPSGVSAQPAISVGTTRDGLRPLPTIDGNVPVSP